MPPMIPKIPPKTIPKTATRILSLGPAKPLLMREIAIKDGIVHNSGMMKIDSKIKTIKIKIHPALVIKVTPF